MFLICSHADVALRGYDALVQAAREGRINQERLNVSLERIAAFKALIQPPLDFDPERFQKLADETVMLNRKLNYTYGGTI
jgi:hypothetical protein